MYIITILLASAISYKVAEVIVLLVLASSTYVHNILMHHASNIASQLLVLLGLALLPPSVLDVALEVVLVFGLLRGGDVTGADVYILSFPGLLSRRT